MKKVCLLFACVAMFTSGIAQVQFAVKAGITPAREMGTNPLVVNRHDPTSDFLFNGEKVKFSPTLGVALRWTMKQFFFEGEALYSSMRRSYAMRYIESALIEAVPHAMEESCKSIDFPLTAGVKLGRIEVTSGFSMRYEFDQVSTLSQIQNLSRKIDNTVFGWHSGIGINLGKAFVEVDYLQDFANYGQGIFVNGDELLLRNSPSQFRFMVGWRF